MHVERDTQGEAQHTGGNDMSAQVNLPGRLGDPGMELKSDPRADPRMLAAMAPFGLDVAPDPVPFTGESSIEELSEFAKMAEPGFETLFDTMLLSLPEVEGVIRETTQIEGVDGNQIQLFIHRPANASGPLPGIVHTHGGGMVIMKAAGPQYVHWRDSLAALGSVVVGVEFRNGGGALGDHPFPAGLNDCASAAQWVAANMDDLGMSHMIISGESGGGNLSIATTIKAKQDGWLDKVSGVYAQCPYISGVYANPTADLPSLVENDGYFLGVSMMGALAKLYDPTGENATNPLAWPMHASVDDCAGLPPFVISVNELDPLRDEGLAFFRTLLAADVDARSRTINGTCHAGDCVFAEAIPEVYAETLDDIVRFANRVG